MVMPNDKDKEEEEDLDDLDDVLSQFTTQAPSQSAPPEPKTTSAAPPRPTQTEFDQDDFSKRFAAEMEEVLRKMKAEEEPSAPSASSDLPQSSTTRDAVVESSEGGSNQKTREDDAFQKAIRQTMEKLQESDETFKTDPQGGQETLENLLASLGDLNLDDAPDGENLESMLETMMSQLMSKEILYEPLKELDTKYPEYLSNKSSTLSSEDLSRYTHQKECVSQIVTLFENPSYADDNPTQSAEVLRLMNDMQSYGSPPSEIMGAMPPGFDFGPDGLPNVPDGCIIA